MVLLKTLINKIVIFVILMTIIVTSLPLQPRTYASVNIATNGDFESNPINANGWATQNWLNTPTYTWATDQAFNGAHSASISVSSSAGAFRKAVGDSVTLVPGNSYKFSVWRKMSNLTGIGSKVWMEQLDSAGAIIAGTRWDSNYETGTAAWRNITTTFTAAPTAVSVRLYLFVNGTGTVWFDDMEITTRGGVTPSLTTPLFDRNGMPQATSVTLLDLRGPYSDGDSTDAIVSAQVIQGLINRTNANKIYFYNDSWDWTHPYQTDPTKNNGWIWAQEILNQAPDLKNLPRTTLSRSSGTNGGLRTLITNYQSAIKGLIIWDDNLTGQVRQASAAAAVTIAAQNNWLAVSPAVKDDIVAWGFNIPVQMDLRTNHFSTDWEVLNWQVDNYFATSNQNHKAVFSMGLDGYRSVNLVGAGGAPWESDTRFNEGAVDYAVATNGFMFNLDVADSNDDTALMNLLYKYTEGQMAILGWVPTHPNRNGFAEVPQILNGTSYSVTGGNQLTNYSVYGSFPDSSYKLDDAVAYPVAPNDVFVVFKGTDGDAVNLGFQFMLKQWTVGKSGALGQVPMSISINPQLANVAPAVWNYFAQNLPSGDDIMFNWSDKSIRDSDTSSAILGNTFKDYAKLTDTPVYYHSYGDETKADIVKWAGIILGRENLNGLIKLSSSNRATTYSTLMVSGDIETGRTVQETADLIRSTVSNRTPAFIVVHMGWGGAEFYQRAKNIMDNLKSNSNGRNYQFLKARDWSYTYSTYQGQNWSW
ncbi:GxGYxYP domain-containing protein [Cohnella sp. WQ 127256]|uniref:GxGYxYP domain-containing protein n=1 Tax=Cohnella sp. WQ 127256 TaxID=2938790 RepID=UPI0021179428|nr:GxGYxYP domain-containing protein [Cohnella sp. WQ 127256]